MKYFRLMKIGFKREAHMPGSIITERLFIVCRAKKYQKKICFVWSASERFTLLIKQSGFMLRCHKSGRSWSRVEENFIGGWHNRRRPLNAAECVQESSYDYLNHKFMSNDLLPSPLRSRTIHILCVAGVYNLFILLMCSRCLQRKLFIMCYILCCLWFCHVNPT